MLDPIFVPFIEKSPISVIARGLLEHAMSPDQLDEWFDSTAQEQYTKDLLFSTIFNLMSLVVRGSYHSVHSAYSIDHHIGSEEQQPGEEYFDPDQGGQAPRQVYQRAIETGMYAELPMTKTLGVLQRN